MKSAAVPNLPNLPTTPEFAAVKISDRRQWRMVALIGAVCAAPVLASYLAYYILQPAGRTNYGALVEPQRPTPPLALHALDGTSYQAAALRGHWVMLQVAGGACGGDCRHQLWIQRQVRLTTGRERERIQRVWLVTDAAPVDAQLLREHAGLLVLRADPAELAAFLPLPLPVSSATAGAAHPANDVDDGARAPGSQPPGAQLSDHIWLVDPLGNLMLRWPAAADPQRMKRDLTRLLAASTVG